MIVVLGNYVAWEAEFERLSHMPDPKTIAELDTLLLNQFAVTQESVHIITGSLKSSGKMASVVNNADHSWTGTIEYGGVSAGINNPVDYAIYEKARGDAHDFLMNAELLDDLYAEAVKNGLD